MKIIPIILIALCASAAQAATPAVVQSETCVQIRTQINAQTGILPRPDTAMLEKIGTHPECRFSAAEVYRAAYGDKPMPKNDHRGKHRDDDDD
jgi:hypothetical protein